MSIENEQDTKETETTPTDNTDKSRRNFLKLGLAGVGAAAVAATGVVAVKRMEGIPQDEHPEPINADYKPIDQRSQIATYADSKALFDKHPERDRAFNEMLKKEDPDNYKPFNFHEARLAFKSAPPRDSPGYGQIDKALVIAGFSSAFQLLGSRFIDGVDSGVSTWQQNMLAKRKHEFESPTEAANNIKRAASLFGAVRCGITKRDKRWDYDPLYDASKEKELYWEKDFPFEPKTVIVIMSDMDYEAMATAPAWTADATVGDAYANAIKIAGQIATFLRGLGYKAVASLNDLGANPPYAIAAGLGEEARNGQVITPGYGPRVRISKVYTDLDFVEYDVPRDYGVASFCLNCMRCADSCPPKAITFGDKTWGPEYSTDPDYLWASCQGIYKFHNDAQKCAKFWMDNDGSCGSCIASCPYNKPDFWHHRLVDSQNVIAPGPVHAFMREMDIFFGYGKVGDPDKVKRFWKHNNKG
jgi:epoxyqueuosine reductase